MKTSTVLDKPSYHRLSEEKEEDEEENSPNLAGKTDRDSSSWHLGWPAINLKDDPLDSDEQEANEGRLARDLRNSRTAVRIWRLVSMALAAALTVSCVLLLSRHDDGPCKADYPQPAEGTDNVLKWMKEAEVADGHFWCGSTIAEAKHRGCTFDKLHNRWMSPAAAALNLGTKADMVVHAWEHAKHCATVILNETRRSPAWDDVASFGHTQSGVCW
ncbi:hypothetical protein ColKHC_11084 [Colletotrichum higginsianum]|nr:hypothetical protein ColKHC_11084 [Colletotrichum higginsianum]